jgi:hypothetical protein
LIVGCFGTSFGIALRLCRFRQGTCNCLSQRVRFFRVLGAQRVATPRSSGPAISTRELVVVRRFRVRFFRVVDVQGELQRGDDQEVRSRRGSWGVLRRAGSIPSGARGGTRVGALRCLRLDLNIRFFGSGPRRWMRRQIVRRLLTPLVLACLMGQGLKSRDVPRSETVKETYLLYVTMIMIPLVRVPLPFPCRSSSAIFIVPIPLIFNGPV